MASQLTVLGPGARRHVVKVTPATYLSDVLSESCTKFRLDPAQYGLKHHAKTVDVSRTVRLAGLTSGAKLELTQVSRSPSVVSVALQLPDSSRLLDKFPSTTSLWLILRKFEAGAAGAGGGGTDGAGAGGAQATQQKNFTARGVPRKGTDGSSGRLYHDAPALHIMGRDYASFVDLQKTLGQLGFNNGSVLLKLSFAASDDPLEEAMERISQYFKSVEERTAPGAQAGSAASDEQAAEVPPEPSPVPTPAVTAATPAPSQPAPESDEPEPMDAMPTAAAVVHQTQTVPGSPTATRATLVYAPPSTAIPQAALQNYNPQDYVPSVEHAKAHQATLNRATQNRRLQTDAELETEKAAAAEKLGDVGEVTIKVRFPDQSSTVTPFRSGDTVEDLYAHVRSLLAREGEPFALQYAGPKGQTTLASSQKKLIANLGLTGRIMVSVVWAPEASAEARKGPSLKGEVAQKQQQYKVIEIAEPAGNEVVGTGSSNSKPTGDGKEKKRDGVPKWLKFGKK